MDTMTEHWGHLLNRRPSEPEISPVADAEVAAEAAAPAEAEGAMGSGGDEASHATVPPSISETPPNSSNGLTIMEQLLIAERDSIM